MNKKYTLVFTIILLAALSRVLPHPSNFAPITALAIFSGYSFKKDFKAYLFPIFAMFLSDLILQITTGFGIWPGMYIVYATFVLITIFAQIAVKKASFINLTWVSLASSLMFFVVTNFAMWTSSGFYEHTTAGFIKCYIMAIPFFGNSIMGDLFYTAVIFGVYSLVSKKYPAFAKI
jgi:hypothetical protein